MNDSPDKDPAHENSLVSKAQVHVPPAEAVLAVDSTASLERIAEAAGLTRVTIHRRFSSRQALIDALSARLNEQYLLALKQARAETAPPAVALHRLTEIIFELKISHRFTMDLNSDSLTGRPLLSRQAADGLDALFARLFTAGAITSADPAWGRQLYLTLLCEVGGLPEDAPSLNGAANDPSDKAGARTDLLVSTVIGALGGRNSRDTAQ
ncbi:TetR/AcrR family transcriptional regulator [Streptomyces niveus]|uniref:TetR/AcrR family transcriptional regulator n=1 Tax=Streptomyces niveus TaxID=193462 RepID=UPI003428BAAC